MQKVEEDRKGPIDLEDGREEMERH